MKTRQGFVSNSSSTSFTVVLLGNSDGVEYRIFNIITKALAGKVPEFTRYTVGELRDLHLEEQKKLLRDKNFGEISLTKLKEIQKDKKLMAALQETVQFLSSAWWSASTLRAVREPHYVIHPLVQALDKVTSDLRSIEIKLKNVTEELNKIKNLDKSSEIIHWVENNGCSADSLLDMVTMLEKEGVLRLLEQKHT